MTAGRAWRAVGGAGNGITGMFKSTAIAAVQAGVLVVITSIGAIALRLYWLACRARMVETREQR
jgi:hypothetical protein